MPYYRRNIVVLSATIFLTALSWNQVVPFLPLFLKEMNVGRHLFQWVGVVFSAGAVASIIAMPFWGKMGDSYGRKAMVIRAGVCLTGIYFGMSICRAAWQVALFRFLNGALTGFIPGSVTLIATNTPREFAPRSVATAQSASAAGLIVGPAVGGLLAELIGYRGAMRISGLCVGICTLLVWLLVQEPNKGERPEKTSLLQDFSVSLRSPVMSSMMLAVMAAWMFSAAIGPFLTLHLHGMDRGAPDWLAGAVFALPAAAFLLSAHSWTRLGERVGYERAILTGLIGGGVATIALAFASSIWVFGLLYFVAGVWMAAVSPSAGAMMCTQIEESFRGRAYGMLQSAGMLGALIAPLAATQIASVFGLRAIFALTGVICIAGALGFRLVFGQET